MHKTSVFLATKTTKLADRGCSAKKERFEIKAQKTKEMRAYC
jgi:hypothetical protein